MKPLQIFNKTRSMDKETEQFSKILCDESYEKGRNMGKLNPPNDSCDPVKLPYRTVIVKKCLQFLNNASGFFENALQKGKTVYEQIKKAYEEQDILGDLKIKLDNLVAEEKKDLKKVSKATKKRNANSEERITELKHQVRNDEIDLGKLKYTNTFWGVLFGGCAIAIVLISEIFVNQKAFLFQRGENFLTALLIASGVSICTLILGSAVAKTMDSDKYEFNQKIAYIALYTLVALGIYYGVSYMRFSMLNSIADGRNGFVASKTILMLLNTGFFVSLVLVKFYIYPRPSVFRTNNEIKALKKSIKEKLEKIDSLIAEINASNGKKKEEQNAIKASYKAEKDGLINEVKNKFKTLENHQLDYNQTLATAKNFYLEINSLANQAFGIYIDAINTYTSKAQLVLPEKGIDLLDPFKDYKMIEEEIIFNLTQKTNPTKDINYEDIDFSIEELLQE